MQILVHIPVEQVSVQIVRIVWMFLFIFFIQHIRVLPHYRRIVFVLRFRLFRNGILRIVFDEHGGLYTVTQIVRYPVPIVIIQPGENISRVLRKFFNLRIAEQIPSALCKVVCDRFVKPLLIRQLIFGFFLKLCILLQNAIPYPLVVLHAEPCTFCRELICSRLHSGYNACFVR